MFSEKLILKLILIPLLVLSGLWGCKDPEPEVEDYSDWQTMTVTASAYNSLKLQGEGDPKITAWGDTLRPGIRSIAVSRDLIKKGLDYNTPVKIEGFEGVYIVNDKMHPKWRNKIDIYMGIDRQKSLNWGKKKVKISFPAQEEPEPDEVQ